jgi:hypothetical protein
VGINKPEGGVTGSPCILSGTGTTGVASCSVTYTGTAGEAGSDTISAAYQGDLTHVTSGGQTGMQVSFRTTSIQVNCSPSSVPSGQTTTCTATVADTSPGATASPAGTVTFSSKKADQFNAATCTLASSTPTASTCQTVDTPPTTIGTHTITARYNGGGTYKPSTTNAKITVTRGGGTT